MFEYNKLTEKIKHYYRLLKRKNIHNYLLLIGIVGVICGLFFSIPIINKTFAWFVLFGICIKLYDFSEEVERNIIPYDFNSLLPPPKK
ncbi:MAG: hypothetical protein ACNI25_08030 [Halarcobacter sp.]